VSPILGVFASSIQNAIANATSYESIATVTVGSGGTSTVTFSSIPSTYQHLQIRGIIRNTAANDYTLRGRFNSDTGSNYARHSLKGNGSTASAFGESSQPYIGFDEIAPLSTGTANAFGALVIDILDYKDSNKNKVTRELAGFDTNGAGRIIFNSGLWQSTSAITQIQFFMAADNFAEYSTFALYGIKGN
jgi:hypothetical protein